MSPNKLTNDKASEIAIALPVIATALALALLITEPAHRAPVFEGEVSDGEAVAILQQRCATCHAAQPSDATIKAPPKGITLETLADLTRYASQIESQAVRNRAMPLGNKTGMTLEERARLGAWIARR